MESGAILIYLADKTGRLLPSDGEARYRVLEWLMWQMGGVGPFLGQAHHFLHFNRARRPTRRSAFAMKRAASTACSTGGSAGTLSSPATISIADIAIWPWISRFAWQEIDLGDFPNVKRWYVDIAARPAVQKGYHVPHPSRTTFRCRDHAPVLARRTARLRGRGYSRPLRPASGALLHASARTWRKAGRDLRRRFFSATTSIAARNRARWSNGCSRRRRSPSAASASGQSRGDAARRAHRSRRVASLATQRRRSHAGVLRAGRE